MNTQQPSGRAMVIHPLPTLVIWVALLLTFGFFVVSLSMLAGLKLGESLLHSNPFAAYEALWPGQPATSVALYTQQSARGYISCITRGTSLQSYSFVLAPDTSTQPVVCQDRLRDGVFEVMNVLINKDHVQELTLYSDVLQEEALFLYWGAADGIQMSNDRQQLQLDWDRRTYAAIAYVDTTDSIVKTVTLTAK